VTIVASPPKRPEDDAAQLLFREARQRRRRRWLAAGVLLAVLAAGVLVAVSHSGAKPPGRPPVSPPRPAPYRPVNSADVAPHVAWVDYDGKLHIGDLSGFSQRVIAEVDADPTAPLVTAGGRVLWVRSQYPNPNGSYSPSASPDVLGYDTATGKSYRIATGTQAFASVDRTFIYVQTDSRHLSEYWLNGMPRGRTLRLPAGWFLLKPSLNSDPSPAIANGILVVSTAYPHSSIQPNDGTLAIWNPSNGHVHLLGDAWQISATYTAPGARSSQVAWYPASCGGSNSCTLQITNTADYSSRLVASPGGHFLWGGGFSPDGGQLAVFANSAPIHGDPTAQLALVNTQSGALRLVSGVYVYVGDSVHWADWLPDGRHLITGGLGGGFGSNAPSVDDLVDSQTYGVSPFRFLADHNQDLTISTVVVR
jgi:hypothetical protein